MGWIYHGGREEPEREKTLFYDRIADRFDAVVNHYDLDKRLRIVFEELLTADDLRGKRLLDVGCGTGWFSRRAVELGASVVSLDVGEGLLSEVRRKCRSELVVGDTLALGFADATFDVVLSSECIEHTVSPARAVAEQCRVLKPGGFLVLTVPNRTWHFAVKLANALRLRPYEGYENWVRWGELRMVLEGSGMRVLSQIGFHLFPFVVPFFHPVLDFFDRFGGALGPLMVNIAAKAQKIGR